MKNLRSVAVFCGSSDGASEKYMRLASALGEKCAENSLSVYYGGAKLGLMGAVAEAALQKNGKVIGIMPDFFAEDVVSAKNLSQMIYVKSMSERKQLMERLADAFITLPGSNFLKSSLMRSWASITSLSYCLTMTVITMRCCRRSNVFWMRVSSVLSIAV